METLTIAAIILFGLAWGSFLNVVIYRLPLGKSLVAPPSSCPSCGARIRPADNIPILSFLILRGRCRKCGAPIGFTTLFVELLTPFILVLLHLRFGLGVPFFASALFASALIALAFIDYAHLVLPDAITLPGTALALAYSFFRRDGLDIVQALLGAAVGAGFLLLIYAGYRLLRKKEGLGLGDVTMMLMVGAFLGWLPALLVIVLASLAGSIIGLAVVKLKKEDLQYALPYGTFLAPAAFIVLMWGNQILTAYASLFRR
jgi:leader peptidase (prepilin peptidase)/N-methyltransferase